MDQRIQDELQMLIDSITGIVAFEQIFLLDYMQQENHMLTQT
ncbi:hypothetical protein [Serpentinicella alkaliphila]|nr:hypothetical protein [Serpentinicella alkaliphila]